MPLQQLGAFMMSPKIMAGPAVLLALASGSRATVGITSSAAAAGSASSEQTRRAVIVDGAFEFPELGYFDSSGGNYADNYGRTTSH